MEYTSKFKQNEPGKKDCEGDGNVKSEGQEKRKQTRKWKDRVQIGRATNC
jgi:hypothetical protein